jgi:anti-sigma regulatory factor (Ser/Thr protein kinase)
VADPDHDDCVLSTPPDGARVLRYHADLAGVRAFAAAAARQAGRLPGRVRGFVIAVSELAANTLTHTKGPGTLTVWSTRHELIGQVRDTGHITGPHPGQVRPGTDPHRAGRDRHPDLHAPESLARGLTSARSRLAALRFPRLPLPPLPRATVPCPAAVVPPIWRP